MESGPICRPGNRPRMLMCYLCGREYGTRSLPIHIPQCQKKWLLEEENKPKNQRRPLPPKPNAEKAISGGGAQAFDTFNSEAFAAFEQTLQQCPHCQRRFLPKPYLAHQKGCTASNPAKPAGTGLIPISLTNRMVPGAVAGSMHGKARTQHLPLRLCKPPDKSKSNLRMSRPASARPAWTGPGADDNSLPLDGRDVGQSSNWNYNSNCVDPAGTRNRLPNSRPFSAHSGSNGGFCGGDQSHLVDTFGDLWRTHSREDNPRHRPSGAQEWCSQGETETSLSLRRAANPRPKNALPSKNRQSPSATLRSSQGYPMPAGQAGGSDNYKLLQGKTTADPRQQRRHF